MDEVKKVLELSGFNELNPPQQLAINAGLLEGKNLVVASPTASGKTIIAEIAALRTIKQGKKVVYIVPLRALASEKYEEFKNKYEPLGIKVALSIGDLDSSDPWLGNYDFIIVTSEKLDSLLRHGIPWAESIGLVVADEIHLLDSPERGPTLEVVLTRLNQIANPEILALSATISNYKELAEWLNAEAVWSDYRPVMLYRGICFDGSIDFLPKKQIRINPDNPSLLEIVNDTLKIGKQALVFVSTRRSSESTAEKLVNIIAKKLSAEEKIKLLELSQKVLKILEHPTKQCEKLSDCVKNGVAFHHAGLTNKQRNLIESSFRDGLIKVITATPTLAFGVNLPSYRVVIRDLKRFSSFRGMDYMPILEVQQMMGRSGRPKYDSSGEAILLPKTKPEAEYAWENYIKGEPEKIYSKLGVEPVLRTHVLALIASEVTRNRKELMNFFSKTFYAFQYKDLGSLENKLEKVISLLEEFGFIETKATTQGIGPFRPASDLQDSGFKATRIGKRVSELYIDPLTANHITKNLKKTESPTDLNLLQIICNTREMKPLLSLKKKDFEEINEFLLKEEKTLIEKPPNPWDFEYDDFLKSIKTSMMFNSWIEEAGEDRILEDFGVTPGELRARLEISDWLLYSSQELGLLLGLMDVLKDIRKLRLRIKYGIKKELLPLIRLKGIGRVKARTLYNAKIKTLADLRKIPIESLERIIGTKTARDVKDQLGELKGELDENPED